jgi:hypothetical protein
VRVTRRAVREVPRSGMLIVWTMAFIGLCGMFSALTSGCTKRDKPIETKWAIVCIDIATQIRQPDTTCATGEYAGYAWAWVRDDPSWPVDLPAVNDRLENGRYSWQRPIDPATDQPILNKQYETVPEKGGAFKR